MGVACANDAGGWGVLTAMRVVALVLIGFGAYAVMVYGGAARRILRHAGVRC